MTDEQYQLEIERLKVRLAYYECDGVAKLYYSLNRKAAEMADMLNNQNLVNLDLTDAKDKSFERIKAIWESAEKVATAVKILGDSCGVTGDEDKDTKPKFRARTPESIADDIGELAGQKY